MRFNRKTALGHKLWDIREKIVANGQALLGWKELEKEVNERRNDHGESLEEI